MDRLNQLLDELEALATRIVKLHEPNQTVLGAHIANLGDLLREIKFVRSEQKKHT